MDDRSSWIIVAVAALGIAAAIDAFYKTPLEKRYLEVLAKHRGNPNLQIAFGVLWLLIALGQLVVNWDKIVWNWPLVIVMIILISGIIYISVGEEANIRKSKARNERDMDF